MSGGSSPRVWGRRAAGLERHGGRRFIPTRVGQTPISSGGRPYLSGSSPRVWGRSWAPRQDLYPTRFIPTRVGQIVGAKAGPVPNPVHPHACGADDCHADAARQYRPVHPHACGADSKPFARPRSRPQVHPHACGADISSLPPACSAKRFIPTRVGQTHRKHWGFKPHEPSKSQPTQPTLPAPSRLHGQPGPARVGRARRCRSGSSSDPRPLAP